MILLARVPGWQDVIRVFASDSVSMKLSLSFKLNVSRLRLPALSIPTSCAFSTAAVPEIADTTHLRLPKYKLTKSANEVRTHPTHPQSMASTHQQQLPSQIPGEEPPGRQQVKGGTSWEAAAVAAALEAAHAKFDGLSGERSDEDGQ